MLKYRPCYCRSIFSSPHFLFKEKKKLILAQIFFATFWLIIPFYFCPLLFGTLKVDEGNNVFTLIFLLLLEEFSDATLRHGRGLALMCTPSCGTLSGYERRVITVSCQSDIWGDYNDLLSCKVSISTCIDYSLSGTWEFC